MFAVLFCGKRLEVLLPALIVLPILFVHASQKEDGSRWHGEFSSSYIEEVTHKTGNFKKFSVFVKMLGTSLKQARFPIAAQPSRASVVLPDFKR